MDNFGFDLELSPDQRQDIKSYENLWLILYIYKTFVFHIVQTWLLIYINRVLQLHVSWLVMDMLQWLDISVAYVMHWLSIWNNRSDNVNRSVYCPSLTQSQNYLISPWEVWMKI